MPRIRQGPRSSTPPTLMDDAFGSLTRWSRAADSLAREGPRGAWKPFALAVGAGVTSWALFRSVGPWSRGPIWSPLFTVLACLLALGSVVMVRAGVRCFTGPPPPVPMDALSLMDAVERRDGPVRVCTQCRLIWRETDSVCPHCESAGDRFEVKTAEDFTALGKTLRWD